MLRPIASSVTIFAEPAIPSSGSVLYRNPHFKSVASGKEAPEDTGGQVCHGPRGNHIASRGSKATIRAFSVLPPENLDSS
jgi:hypothetical protein